MKHRLFISLISALILCGCEYDFSLDHMDQESKVYLKGLVGNGGVTYLDIEKVVSINANDSDAINIQNIDFIKNGEEFDVRKFDISSTIPEEERPFYRFDRNYWYVDCPVNSGDEIEIRVQAQGMKESSARTVIPKKVELVDVKTEIEKEVVTYSILDEPETVYYLHYTAGIKDFSEDDFYGVAVKVTNYYKVIDSKGEESVSTYAYYDTFPSSDNMFSFESGNPDGWLRTNLSKVAAYIYPTSDNLTFDMISGKQIKDGILDYKIDYERDYSDSYTYWEEDGNGNIVEMSEQYSTRHDYQLVIFRLSPEFYRYAKARELLEDNILMEAGLSPATYSYTNMENGFGVFCSMSEITECQPFTSTAE